MRHQGISYIALVLAAVFCVCLIVSNLFVPRLWQLGNTSLQLSGAVVVFPISYIINDLVTEVYGYRRAMQMIWLGFILNAFVAVAAYLVTLLPAPIYPESQEIAASFNRLFGLIPRTTIASWIAFVAGEYINSRVMSRMKVAMQGKGFGWRAVLSSIAGELTDSVIFYPLAFVGTLPFLSILWIIVMQVGCKTLYEVVILPVTAVLARKLKQVEGIDAFDHGESYHLFKIK